MLPIGNFPMSRHSKISETQKMEVSWDWWLSPVQFLSAMSFVCVFCIEGCLLLEVVVQYCLNPAHFVLSWYLQNSPIGDYLHLTWWLHFVLCVVLANYINSWSYLVGRSIGYIPAGCLYFLDVPECEKSSFTNLSWHSDEDMVELRESCSAYKRWGFPCWVLCWSSNLGSGLALAWDCSWTQGKIRSSAYMRWLKCRWHVQGMGMCHQPLVLRLYACPASPEARAACACPVALWSSRHPAAQAEQQQSSSAITKSCILQASRCAAKSQIPLFILFLIWEHFTDGKGSPNWENLEMGVPTCSSRMYECLIDEVLHWCFAELLQQGWLQLVSPFHIHSITESKNGLSGKDP